jgi:hypothetical protein
VLDLIILGKGTNDKVEEFCGQNALLLPTAMIADHLASGWSDDEDMIM